jgi:hypothetical protein
MPAETEAFETFLAGSGAAPWPSGTGEWVGVPTMNAPLKPLAEGLDVRRGVRVGALRFAEGWTLTDVSDKSIGVFDLVISTVPAPQARDLVAGDPALAAALDRVVMAPQWAVMLGWKDAPGDNFDALHTGGPLDLIARMASKPGRAGPMDCWVAHASAHWSRQHLEIERDSVPGLLIPEIEAVLGHSLPPPDYAAHHLWRYSRTEVPLGEPFLASGDGTLYMGGDWTLGPNAEHAYLSGVAMAGAVLARAFP